ncbi:MAG: hypothetical protein HY296_08145 [Thaumarchaeota archaeon]|nr:hypothetical protein [Nitrososphaerota archaeon]
MSEAARRYRLCQFCIDREGPGTHFDEVDGPSCSVCSGLFDRIPQAVEGAASQMRRYQFRSFTVGMTLPEGIQEKEDELRSALRLKGSETVKTQAVRLFAVLLAKKVRKPVNKLKPDLTLLVGMSDGSSSVTTRPLFYYGRYTKPPGMSQRRELCRHCSGAGCEKCSGTGYGSRQSVEWHLRRRLGAIAGSDRMTFTWMGTEDLESRVLAPGRPFIAELKNPLRRVLPKRFASRFRGKQVSVDRGRLLVSRPLRVPPFRFRTLITCTSRTAIHPDRIHELGKRFRRADVRFDRPHNRPVTKTVYSAKGSARGRRLIVEAVLDGGLPVKRFISGELVSPSVSEVLKTEVRCRSFDICEVRERGSFTYAEVTRI